MQQLGLPIVLGELPFALFAAVALAALPLAVLTALGLIWLFRRAVARSMAASAGAGEPLQPAPSRAGDSQGELEIDWVPASSMRPAASTLAALDRVHRARRRSVWLYVVATGSCSLILTLLLMVRTGFSPVEAGMLKTTILILLSHACARYSCRAGGSRGDVATGHRHVARSPAAAHRDPDSRPPHRHRQRRPVGNDRRCTHGGDPAAQHATASRRRADRLCRVDHYPIFRRRRANLRHTAAMGPYRPDQLRARRPCTAAVS